MLLQEKIIKEKTTLHQAYNTKIEIERMLNLLTILWHDKKLEKMEVRNWEKKNKKVGFSLFKGNMDILHLFILDHFCPRY